MYLLREDMYNEWSWENGATDIICLSKNINTILNMFENKVEEYLKENRLIETYIITEIEEKLKNKENVYLDIYENAVSAGNAQAFFAPYVPLSVASYKLRYGKA